MQMRSRIEDDCATLGIVGLLAYGLHGDRSSRSRW
jgi:hypothetical protein